MPSKRPLVTLSDTERQAGTALVPGLYRIFWTNGKDSVAAVGVDHHGENWVAPVDWIQPGVLDWAWVLGYTPIELKDPTR